MLFQHASVSSPSAAAAAAEADAARPPDRPTAIYLSARTRRQQASPSGCSLIQQATLLGGPRCRSWWGMGVAFFLFLFFSPRVLALGEMGKTREAGRTWRPLWEMRNIRRKKKGGVGTNSPGVLVGDSSSRLLVCLFRLTQRFRSERDWRSGHVSSSSRRRGTADEWSVNFCSLSLSRSWEIRLATVVVVVVFCVTPMPSPPFSSFPFFFPLD